jgi:excisionase family DNA binding protein
LRRELLTTSEVCEVTRLAPRTIAQKIKDGSLPVVRIGRNVRIASDDLEAWIDRMKQQSATPEEVPA